MDKALIYTVHIFKANIRPKTRRSKFCDHLNIYFYYLNFLNLFLLFFVNLTERAGLYRILDWILDNISDNDGSCQNNIFNNNNSSSSTSRYNTTNSLYSSTTNRYNTTAKPVTGSSTSSNSTTTRINGSGWEKTRRIYVCKILLKSLYNIMFLCKKSPRRHLGIVFLHLGHFVTHCVRQISKIFFFLDLRFANS